MNSNPSWGFADDSLRCSLIPRLMISSGETPNRAESRSNSLTVSSDNVIAYITDANLNTDKPVYKPDDIDLASNGHHI